MKNIQLHPTHKMVVPNDRATKLLFKVTPEKYQKYMSQESTLAVWEKNKCKKLDDIDTPIEFYVDPAVVAEDPSVTEVLCRFDNDVANVCISEWEAGNRYVTYSTIYRTLTGKVGDSDSIPSKVQLAKIKHSLKKLMNIQLSIFFYDACEKLGYNNGKKIFIKDKIIPAQFVDCTVNGQNTKVIELTAESPLLKVARLKNNQIISYDVELLNIPNQKNTPLNIELKHYAIRRVMETIAHPKQMSPAITFVDVLAKCRIADADNKKKHRVRESLKSVFEHLVTCGVIESYQVNKKAGVFYSISFAFGKTQSKGQQTLVKKTEIKKETPSKKEIESKPIEDTNEKRAKDSVVSALWKTPQLPWKYSPITLSMTPWNNVYNAFLLLLQKQQFSLF